MRAHQAWIRVPTTQTVWMTVHQTRLQAASV
jgi:hypothetical protein